ncbi:gastrula zinc finger protein XlCGF66.1-like, partial [Mantella aurantiaca]
MGATNRLSKDFYHMKLKPGVRWKRRRCWNWQQRRDIDHMTTSMRMEEEQSHMTERILNLTLEIIYLLTGESYPPVKSGDQVTIMVPPPHSLKPERNYVEKILEVIQKMIGVLTGEEWEYLEGHKDLYKDVMMDNQPPLTSPGHAMEKPSKDHLTLSPGCKMEDEDITGEMTMISSMDGGDHSVDRSWDPSDQPCTVRDGAATREEKTFSSPECEESFNSELSVTEDQRSHMSDNPN